MDERDAAVDDEYAMDMQCMHEHQRYCAACERIEDLEAEIDRAHAIVNVLWVASGVNIRVHTYDSSHILSIMCY